MQTALQKDSPVSLSYERLAGVGGDPLLLEEPHRSVVLADTAFGLIGNGGVEHFFASDFPHCPEYGVFSNAFRNLDLSVVADGLDQLVGLFPFSQPHLHQQLRILFLGAPSSAFQSAVARFNQLVWSDSSLDERLHIYHSRSAA